VLKSLSLSGTLRKGKDTKGRSARDTWFSTNEKTPQSIFSLAQQGIMAAQAALPAFLYVSLLLFYVFKQKTIPCKE